MDIFTSAKAIALVACAGTVDAATRVFMEMILEAESFEPNPSFGVKFFPVEGDDFALTATVHRRVVDIEVQHAIWTASGHQQVQRFLVGKVFVFLRDKDNERIELGCNYSILSNGDLNLDVMEFSLVHDVLPNNKIMVRDSLAKLILVAVQDRLPVAENK